MVPSADELQRTVFAGLSVGPVFHWPSLVPHLDGIIMQHNILLFPSGETTLTPTPVQTRVLVSVVLLV